MNTLNRMIGNPLQDESKISGRINAIELGRANQSINRRRPLSPGVGPGKPHANEQLDRLVLYTAPLMPAFALRLSDEKQDAFAKVALQHMQFGTLALLVGSDDEDVPPFVLPIRSRIASLDIEPGGIPDAVLDATAFREFFEAMHSHSEIVLQEFDNAIKD